MIHSYSSIATFRKCPAKWNWSYKNRLPVPRESSPQMIRGDEIHKSIDAYLKGQAEFLHQDIHKDYGQFMMGLRAGYQDIRPEFKWGITRDLQPCDFKDPEAMLRGVWDLLIVPEGEELLLYEWKTGKVYPHEHAAQLWLYSTVAMLYFPEKSVVKGNIVYLDEVDYKTIDYYKSMMFEYRPALLRDIREIEETTEFIPKPSYSCKWCPFSKYNGGPCAF